MKIKPQPGGLCLTRRLGEKIIIENELEIQVVQVESGAVRLKFQELGSKRFEIEREERLKVVAGVKA